MTTPASPGELLNLLLPLPFTHPSVIPLLAHRPFTYPSHLSSSALSKYLNRLNTTILSKDPSPSTERERREACDVASKIVKMDKEGWVLGEYGKGWLGAMLGGLTAVTLSKASTSYLNLLSIIILQSPKYPSFEREAVHPIMGKVAVTLTKTLERCVVESKRDHAVLCDLLQHLRTLIIHSPASFRPSVQYLRPVLLSILLRLPVPAPTSTSDPGPSTTHTPIYPDEVKLAAADVLASLHLTSGKAQIPGMWANEMRDALGGIGASLTAIVGDGWMEEPFRVAPPPPPAVASFPVDFSERVPAALDQLEGWLEAVLALLKFPTSRPVPIPLAQIVAAGLRCLNLTLDTPTVAYISPQHHAMLLAGLPRIWTAGMLLIGAVATACGDHLFPHLSNIMDHTIWLAEKTPSSLSDVHLQLLHFHTLFLELYTPALLPVEYPTRLLRHSLSLLSPLLDPKSSATAISSQVTNGSGKRGKKRARGGEDSLVGGLEGREGKYISPAESEIITEALKLAALLHPTPLLPPALLTFSIRLHLSVHLALPGMISSFASAESWDQVTSGVQQVLEAAMLMTEGENGTARGWKSVVLSVLEPRGERLSLLIHPSQPPLLRPLPPLAQMHHFAPETEEEKRLKQEMGFGVAADQDDDQPATTDRMDLDAAFDHSRPIVPVAHIDTASTSSTTVGPAPRASDLALSSNPAAVHRAVLTSPSTAQPTRDPNVRSGDEGPGDSAIVKPDPPGPAIISRSATTAASAEVSNPQAVLAATSSKSVSNSVQPSTTSAEPNAIETTITFMSKETGKSTGKAKEVASAAATAIVQSKASLAAEDSDGPMPELDSGDSDMDWDEEEQEELE